MSFFCKRSNVYCLFLEFILVHARSINGDVVRSFRCVPTETELVPCLSEDVDRLVDSLGYLPSTVFRIHSAYLTACKVANPHEAEKAFIRQMGQYKFPLLEAAMVWGIVAKGPQSRNHYREREAMGTV